MTPNTSLSQGQSIRGTKTCEFLINRPHHFHGLSQSKYSVLSHNLIQCYQGGSFIRKTKNKERQKTWSVVHTLLELSTCPDKNVWYLDNKITLDFKKTESISFCLLTNLPMSMYSFSSTVVG